MINRRSTLILVAVFTGLAIVAIFFEHSFVIGRRGFDTAEGAVARYIGGFWLYLALLTLSMLIADPLKRKTVGELLTWVFFGLVFGSAIYFLANKPA